MKMRTRSQKAKSLLLKAMERSDKYLRERAPRTSPSMLTTYSPESVNRPQPLKTATVLVTPPSRAPHLSPPIQCDGYVYWKVLPTSESSCLVQNTPKRKIRVRQGSRTKRKVERRHYGFFTGTRSAVKRIRGSSSFDWASFVATLDQEEQAGRMNVDRASEQSVKMKPIAQSTTTERLLAHNEENTGYESPGATEQVQQPLDYNARNADDTSQPKLMRCSFRGFRQQAQH